MVIDLFCSSDDGPDDDDPDDDTEIVADRAAFENRPPTEHHDHSPTQNKSLLDMATGNDTTPNTDDAPADQPTQLDMVNQELKLLIKTCFAKQIPLRERQELFDLYADLSQNIVNLVGYELTFVFPEQNPTMEEIGSGFAKAKEHLTPDNINGQHAEDLLFKIYNQTQRLQQLIGEKSEFEYTYAETDIGQTYGHEIQSFGIPNSIELSKLPPGEDAEEVYARGRALTAMEDLAEDPTSPLWLGVGTRNGHDASIDKDVLFRHRAIFGQTGYGKSTLLTNDAKQLIQSGAGMCFIDPKGDDSKRLMQIIPEERLDDVLWIEPGANGEHLSGFNYIKLGMEPDDDGYEIARSNLVADLKKMLKMSADYWGPRMDRVAENLITAMNMYNDRTPDDADELNLVDLYYIIKDEASRKEFAARCKKAGLTFVDDYTQEIAEMDSKDLEPLLGRFLPWIENPVARRMIGFRKGGVNIPKAIDENKIIIVRMGSEPRELKQMLGMAVIRRIWSRIRSRANESIYNREPFYLFVDEFDNIALADDTIPSIISESRSYRLSLNIANQYPKQLPGNVVDAITTNCDTIISFNPGDVQSANQYCTQLGVDADTLTEEVNYHVWLRTTLKDNMEKSDAFRAYVYPPHPPKRVEDEAEEAINASLRRHGRRRRSDEETYANLLYNGGGGKWETGVGAQIEMAEEDEIIRDLEAELQAVMPGPENPAVRDKADFGQGSVDDETAAGMDTPSTVLADGESVVEQKQETILEAIFAAAVREGQEPGAFVTHDAVIQELKHRLPDDINVELAEVANAFEQLSTAYVDSERRSGEQHIRLTNSGQANVFDQDTGSDVTGGGNEHRWVIRKSYAIFTRLGYITERVKQDGTELSDLIADAPFDFTDVDDDLAPQKKVEKIEEQRERLQSEYPEVWNLSQGNDVSIEAETTTIKTPVRMLTNLRKAVDEGNTCVFVTKEGDEEFTAWAERGEKNIYETEKDASSREVKIISDKPTFMKGRGSDGIRRYYNKKQNYALDEDRDKVALRPASEKRGSVWYHDPDTGEIVCAPSNRLEIDDDVEKLRFDDLDAVKQGDPTTVPAYYEYNPGKKQYQVNAGGKELAYNSAEELKEDWEPFNEPFIPEHEFDELPTEDDWHFIILPDADNEQYDQPQLYERGECRPLYDAIGADIDSVDINTLSDDAGEDGYEGESFGDEEGEPEIDSGDGPAEYTAAGDDETVATDTASGPEETTGESTTDHADPENDASESDTEPADQSAATTEESHDSQTTDDSGSSVDATNTESDAEESTTEGATGETQPTDGQQQQSQAGEQTAHQQQQSHQQAEEQPQDSEPSASKAEIVTQIDQLTINGEPPSPTAFDEHPQTAPFDDVLAHFGSWPAAVDAAVGGTSSPEPSENATGENTGTTADTTAKSDSVDDTPGGSAEETPSDDGDNDNATTTENETDDDGDVDIPDKWVNPGELADHPDVTIEIDRIGQIGNGSKPTDEEYHQLERVIRGIDQDLGKWIEEKIDLKDVIGTGGDPPNRMQDDDGEQNDDSSDNNTTEEGATDSDPDAETVDDDPEPSEGEDRTDETPSSESEPTPADRETVEDTAATTDTTASGGGTTPDEANSQPDQDTSTETETEIESLYDITSLSDIDGVPISEIADMTNTSRGEVIEYLNKIKSNQAGATNGHADPQEEPTGSSDTGAATNGHNPDTAANETQPSPDDPSDPDPDRQAEPQQDESATSKEETPSGESQSRQQSTDSDSTAANEEPTQSTSSSTNGTTPDSDGTELSGGFRGPVKIPSDETAATDTGESTTTDSEPSAEEAQPRQQPSEPHGTAANEQPTQSPSLSTNGTAPESDGTESNTDMSTSDTTPTTDEQDSQQGEPTTEADPHSTSDTLTPDSTDPNTSTPNSNERDDHTAGTESEEPNENTDDTEDTTTTETRSTDDVDPSNKFGQ